MLEVYNSAREVMEALLAGKKIHNTSWEDGCYIFLKAGELLSSDSEETYYLQFQPNLYNSWEEHVEKPKKMNLYKITSTPYSDSFIVSAFSKKEARIFLHNYLCKTWKDKNDTIDILSVKLSKCERLKINSNFLISSTTDCVKPNI